MSTLPDLALERQEGLLIVSRDDSSLCRPLKLLETLCAVEPGWMISCEPSLWDAVAPLQKIVSATVSTKIWARTTHVFNDVAVIADEEECAAFWEVDLHADQTWSNVSAEGCKCAAGVQVLTIGMSREMVQGNALAEIKCPLVEDFPVQGQPVCPSAKAQRPPEVLTSSNARGKRQHRHQ